MRSEPVLGPAKPDPWVKVRRDHHIVSVAVIPGSSPGTAVGVNSDGRREVLGMTIGHSEAEPFWVEFLRGLTRRGLRGAKLVVSDAHEGLKAAITKILGATWQRCRVHFMRNAIAHAGKTQRRIPGSSPGTSAWIGTAFAQNDADAARKQWRHVADELRPRVSKLATLMDDAEADVLAYMGFPTQHRTKIHSTNPIERLNHEIKRRSDVPRVGLRSPEGRLWDIPQRSRYHQTDWRPAAGAERGVGGPARPLHDPGNHRANE